MKILFLTPWYPDEVSPIHGTFVRDQAMVIAKGHTVRVISVKVDYTKFALSSVSRVNSNFSGVEETRVRIKRSLPFFNQFNYFLRAAIESYRIGRIFRPDIIHSSVGYPGAFWAWIMSKLLGAPYVVTEHTRITNNFRSGIHRTLTLFGLTRADAVIAVSQWHAKEIEAHIGKKPVVIPNVIRFDQIPEPAGYPDATEFQIGFLGGMNTPVKGLDILLQAVSQLDITYRLHIAGQGKLLDRYKQLAKELNIYEKCIFYGTIPHAQIPAFMKKLHVFVCSSRWETFGIAMAEALASGLPVIATDNGGSREFITEENGIIVPTGDPGKLTEAIRYIIHNFNRYSPNTISSLVRAKFSVKTFRTKIDEIYNTAIAHYKRA